VYSIRSILYLLIGKRLNNHSQIKCNCKINIEKNADFRNCVLQKAGKMREVEVWEKSLAKAFGLLRFFHAKKNGQFPHSFKGSQEDNCGIYNILNETIN